MIQKTLLSVLGCTLMLYGGTATAFTLITLPTQQETEAPSDTITESTTLRTEVQPITGTIRSQILSHRRPRGAPRTAQSGPMLAANAHGQSQSDVQYLAAAGGGGTGAGSGNTESLWISAATNSLENDFSRTAFYGATHNLIAGFDATRSDRYVLGVALGHEASNFSTTFNSGNEKTRGFNINPYFAYLLSNTWSVDLILGYGDFDTRQSRTTAALGSPVPLPPVTVAVNSEFSSTRSFASANLTNVSTFGNWRLTGALGLMTTRREQDAYVESNGAAVAATKQTLDQWNLLGEAAYGRGASEGYLGVMYERAEDPPQIQFATGPQPANDPDSVLLSAGWRYFGRGLTANFAFSSRLSLDQVTEYGFAMMIRVDL